MKQYYKIKELSRLYGLCTDTLRYYEEQGLLSPRRSENHYRLFGIQDIGKLNIIRSMRELDIPLERIREYIGSRTVESTLQLLEEEEDLIRQKIRNLEQQLEEIESRREALRTDCLIEDGSFRIESYGERPCFRLEDSVILEDDVDFVLKKLEKQYEDNIHAIGIKGFGARMNVESLRQGIYNHYESVFYLSDWDSYNAVIEAGTYACLYFRGEYSRLPGKLKELNNRISEEQMEICGVPMELYHIDMNDTGRNGEYLTEIQVKVVDKPDQLA